jgi:CD109 antigen
MILPPSLIRGEVLELQGVVYNYLDTDLFNITVFFLKTNDFDKVTILNQNNSKYQYEKINQDLNITIPHIKSQSGKTVSFMISAKNIGKQTLTIRGKCSVAGDTEKRTIMVKAEGIVQNKNKPLLIDLRKENEYQNSFEIKLPLNHISKSDDCSIQITGDLLGKAFNNLNRLINKPYGCGEQNMMGLTPNIFALKYLSSIDSSSYSNVNMLKSNAISNIEFGYQNELNYMHTDGSFSAFGNSDINGSSWLTAFVVKSFSLADQYVKLIDNKIIKKSIDWLILKNQNEDGSFNEPGNIIHKDMQGGVNNKLRITSYILISLLESKTLDLVDKKYLNSITKSIKYLEKQLNGASLNASLPIQEDIYSLCLITYALNLVNSNYADKAFNLFDSYSIKSVPGQLYWSTLKESKLENKDELNSDTNTPSSDIEMTSYGLLIYLLRDDFANSMSIVKWLISKSNSLGAYSSTQNTILALESLSEFGHKYLTNGNNNNNKTYNTDVSILAKNTLNDEILNKTFNINKQNSFILQNWYLPSCDYNLTINANGYGIASLQAIINYNIPSNNFTLESFEIENKLISPSNESNKLEIQTCARYIELDSNGNYSKTGMSIIESNVFSGYEIDKQELDKLLNSKLKMVEFLKDENKVAFYLDYLDNEMVCFDWTMNKVYPVSNIKPILVKIYDYYRPQIEKNTLFELENY